MNWKAGQRLVCISEKQWSNSLGEFSNGPVRDEVVTYDGTPTQVEYIYLREYSHRSWNGKRVAYKAEAFRPLIEDLTASLAHTEAGRLVEERPEVVRVPQPSRA